MEGSVKLMSRDGCHANITRPDLDLTQNFCRCNFSSHTMASKLKAQAEAQSKGKRKHVDDDGDQIIPDGEARPLKKKNKQRVLLLCSRGVTHRMRHLMNDLEILLPHVKKGMSYYIVCHDKILSSLFFQTRNWTPNPSCTSSPNLPTCTTATTRCISRRADMRTCICGQQRHPTGRASSCTSRISIQWTS